VRRLFRQYADDPSRRPIRLIPGHMLIACTSHSRRESRPAPGRAGDHVTTRGTSGVDRASICLAAFRRRLKSTCTPRPTDRPSTARDRRLTGRRRHGERVTARVAGGRAASRTALPAVNGSNEYKPVCWRRVQALVGTERGRQAGSQVFCIARNRVWNLSAQCVHVPCTFLSVQAWSPTKMWNLFQMMIRVVQQ